MAIAGQAAPRITQRHRADERVATRPFLDAPMK